MNEVLDHIHRRLLEEGERVIAFFEAFPLDQIEAVVYSDGSGWNVRQVLSHLVASENAYQHHLEQLLKFGNPLIFDQSLDDFNQVEVRKLERKTVRELLDSFREARRKTLLLVETMNERDLSRTAIHPWFGEQRIGWLLKLIYRHNAMHLQDVRRNLESRAASPRSSEGDERPE